MTTTFPTKGDFSAEQRTIIEAPASARLLVTAGPGTGKTAVACARVDHLIGGGDVAPNRVLLISFTRTAVAELRNRIVSGAVDPDDARSVRVTTIDSQAWRFRAGFGDEDEVAKTIGYDGSIASSLDLIANGSRELVDFIKGIDHLVVDEAQDVGETRSRFLLTLIDRLRPTAGVTVLADRHQAIYGFSEEDGPDEGAERHETLLERLLRSPYSFSPRTLTEVYRTSDEKIRSLLTAARGAVEVAYDDPSAGMRGVRETIAQYARNTGTPVLDDLAGNDKALVLYRTRAEALLASGFLSNKLSEHRLRMSGLPTVASPWIAHVLSEHCQPLLLRKTFDKLWESASRTNVVSELDPDEHWRMLVRAAGDRGRVSMDRLATVLSRERPPVELCEPEVGVRGPILSTIHASKGREADEVRLMLRPPWRRERENDELEEEARVLYVAATRAREEIQLGKGIHRSTKTLDSGRVYSPVSGGAQVQIGCAGDVDPAAHARWPDTSSVQAFLKRLTTKSLHATAESNPDLGFAYVVRAEYEGKQQPIAVLTQRVNRDLFTLAKILAAGSGRPPSILRHLTVFGTRTIGLTPEQRDGLQSPYRESGILLAPVIKGFPKLFGRGRKKRGRRRRY